MSSGAVVVTATRQQAAYLRWRYAQRQTTCGQQAWRAPDIHLLSAWVEQAWETSLIAGGIGARLRLLNRSQSRRLWSQVVSADLEPVAPLLNLVEQAWRTLHDWGISMPTAGQWAGGADAERFLTWANRYQQRCRDGGWVDSVVAMQALQEELAAGPRWLPKQLLFVGFESWQPALQGLANSLQQGHCDARQVQPQATTAGTPQRVEFDDEGQEFRAAATWSAQAWGAGPDRCIAVVIPDLAQSGPALRRAMLDAAQPDWRQRAGVQRPVSGGDARDVADLGAVHAALLCLSLCAERMDYQRLGQLLRSTYIGAASQEMAARARLDVWLRERGERDWEIAVVSNKARELAPELARRLEAIGRRQATGRRSPAGWANWITKHLELMGWPGKDRPHADAASAINAWRELLEHFAACGHVTGQMNFQAARRTLTEMAREARAPGREPGGGLQLLSPAEALGQQFDGLWIAGLHSEAWPPPMRPNPLIPLSLQRQAGVPGAAPDSHARHARSLMQQLWRSANQVVVSAAHRRGDEQLTPTPALAELRAVAASQMIAAYPPSLSEEIAARSETEVVADPAPAMGAEQTHRGGVRLLQLQAICPARAFFELRLQARELPLPSFGIDAATRGQLVHAALDALFRDLRTRELGPDSPEARAAVPAAVAASLKGRLPPNPLNRVLGELEAQRLAGLLNELLEFDAARPAFNVVATEAQLQVPLGRLELALRVDRIDALETDDQLVIDYKTGGQKRRADWFGARPAEPQLPLYAVGSGARSVAYVRLSEDGITIDGIAGNDTGIDGIRTVSQLTQGRLESWPELVDEWQAALVALAAEFAAGACWIDTLAPELAGGQYAPLTRVCDRSDGE